MVEDLPEYIQEELSELQSYFGSIEELCEHEDDIICHSGCDDICLLYTSPSPRDYAAIGRKLETSENYLFTDNGIFSYR